MKSVVSSIFMGDKHFLVSKKDTLLCLPEPESPTRKRRNMYQRVDPVWDEQCASASGAVDWHELSTSCFSVRNTMPPSRCTEQNSSSLPYHCTCTLKMLSCQAENFLSFDKSYTYRVSCLPYNCTFGVIWKRLGMGHFCCTRSSR